MKRSAILSILLVVSALAALALVPLGDAAQVDRDELQHLIQTLDVDPGEVFADVGAGDGRWAIALAPVVGESGRIFATEVDPADLRRIRERVEEEKAGNVTVIEGDQDDTGLPDACCDGILLRRVYHHFQNPQRMQDSLRDALRQHGLLLIIDFDTRRRWARPDGIPDSRDGHGISKEMLVAEMERAGFELASDTDWPNGDYALLFRVAVLD